MLTTSRRDFLKSAATATAIGTGLSLASPSAYAGEIITAIEWGGAYLDMMKKIAAKQSDVAINWQLHAGGSIAILPKIKATWPKPGIDLLTGWDVSWETIAREGWAEPVTIEKVPNLADVPQKLLVNDSAGNIINIPRTISALFWWYREDLAPFEITKLEDLVDPRLKGKICWPAPSLNSNCQAITLALHTGGNERNMEPAWDFLKRLARSGNIGRVANADTDTANSISSGETCITFSSGTQATRLGNSLKIKYLSKMPTQSGFKTFVFHEGWCVLKGGHTDAAFKFANFAINPENDEAFNRGVNAIPANVKSKTADDVQHMAFNKEEMEKYVYVPDWAYLSQEVNAWNKRWEQEIQPLL
ncbi:putative spermidine/putrescine transport system substrate-binding protein [Bradyrhizobium sp. USDA 3686]|uniref:extracellular solute-binding protein n=1 Tax=Bradyrhizobium canariense TaxID=255045 RepID=UPI00195A037E|nr:extracellular solute-binding protein [Bradyrhizobium canariense]MBM7487850.1 putative spermidine/putrescine transport system substrate-binding protein [Bradyrhizobium canariense]